MLAHRSLRRNALLNLLGQMSPALAGLIFIPVVVGHAGIDRFGLLALGWLLLGYFGLLDLGLGRATVKLGSEAYAAGDASRYAAIVQTSFSLHLLLGVVSTIVLLLLAPFVAERMSHGSVRLENEALPTMIVVAIGAPAILLSAAGRSALEATQRFGLVSSLSASSGVLVYLLSAGGAIAGLSIATIVAMLLANRLTLALIQVLVLCSLVPELRRGIWANRPAARELARYGTWVALSNFIAPLLVYGDRLVIAALLGATALGYYVPSSDALTRLWIAPAAVAGVLLPFVSARRSGDAQVSRAYWSASGNLTVAITPLLMLAAVFPDDLLQMWLGSDFATRASDVMRAQALGVAMGAVGYIPFSLLSGLGRPDIPAKVQALEVLPYLLVTLLLTSLFGIVGAAAAWTARAVVEFVLLFLAARRMVGAPPPETLTAARRHGTGLLLVLVALAAIRLLADPAYLRVVLAIGVTATFLIGAFRTAFPRQIASSET